MRWCIPFFLLATGACQTRQRFEPTASDRVPILQEFREPDQAQTAEEEQKLALTDYDDWFEYQPKTRPMAFADFQKRQGTVNSFGEMGDAYGVKSTNSQAIIDELYLQLEVITRVFDKHGIQYVVTGGTQLGALRNGGLIPNDDDIDLFVHAKDRELVKSAAVQADFAAAGFSHGEYTWDKIGLKNGKASAADIFYITEIDGKMRLDSAYARAQFPNNGFSAEHWQPSQFKKLKFGHLQVNALPLAGALESLQNDYGGDWNVSTYKMLDHVTGKPNILARKTALLPGKNGDYFYLPSSQEFASPVFKQFQQPEFIAPPNYKRTWARKLAIPKWIAGSAVAGIIVVAGGITVGSVFAIRAAVKKAEANKSGQVFAPAPLEQEAGD